MSQNFEDKAKRPLTSNPNRYARIEDFDVIKKVGHISTRLRGGEFLGDLDTGQEYNSIFVKIQKDTLGTYLDINEINRSRINSCRFGIFSGLTIIEPEFTGNELYYVEFDQRIYDESEEIVNPRLITNSRYKSTNYLGQNSTRIGSVLRVISLIETIQNNPRDPLERLRL